MYNYKTKNWEIRDAYRKLLKSYVGRIGERTEFKTKITQRLIDTVSKRYVMLCREAGDYTGALNGEA